MNLSFYKLLFFMLLPSLAKCMGSVLDYNDHHENGNSVPPDTVKGVIQLLNVIPVKNSEIFINKNPDIYSAFPSYVGYYERNIFLFNRDGLLSIYNLDSNSLNLCREINSKLVEYGPLINSIKGFSILKNNIGFVINDKLLIFNSYTKNIIYKDESPLLNRATYLMLMDSDKAFSFYGGQAIFNCPDTLMCYSLKSYIFDIAFNNNDTIYMSSVASPSIVDKLYLQNNDINESEIQLTNFDNNFALLGVIEDEMYFLSFDKKYIRIFNKDGNIKSIIKFDKDFLNIDRDVPLEDSFDGIRCVVIDPNQFIFIISINKSILFYMVKSIR